VSNMPTIPPTPWQGNTSNVSSRLVLHFHTTARFDIIAAMTPMKILVGMATKPALGVMATRQTTAPMQKPSTDGFFPLNTSKDIQAKPPAPAEIFVVANAVTASAPELNAEPALKPNQPNQS